MDSAYSLLPLVSSLAYLGGGDWKWLPLLLAALIPLLPLLTKWTETCRCSNPFASRRLEFQASLKLRSWANEPDSIVRQFAVVLWEWNRLNETVGCKRVMEEAISPGYWDESEKDGNMLPLFVDDPGIPFWNKNAPEIQYTMWVDRRANKDGELHGELFLKIAFLQRHATPKTVVEHINALRDLSGEILKVRACKQCVLVSTDEEEPDKERGSGSKGLGFMKYEFNTTSTFDNFFSEEAALVEGDIKTFLSTKASYGRTGRPWTYTLLNEGLPGTGKTKLVKAVAAMTGRTLIVLNLQHITSVRLLYDAFHSSVLSGDHIPHDRRLYYIPEVDTQRLEQLKQRPTGATVPSVAATTLANRVGVPVPPTTGNNANPWSSVVLKQPPTLGEILNVLDGVPERHGHILIMDTNALQQLDKALIRPGRVNRILSWGPMTASSTAHLVANHFAMSASAFCASMPDRVLTAAELQGLLVNSATAEEAVASLKKLMPKNGTIKDHTDLTNHKNEVPTLRLRKPRVQTEPLDAISRGLLVQ